MAQGSVGSSQVIRSRLGVDRKTLGRMGPPLARAWRRYVAARHRLVEANLLLVLGEPVHGDGQAPMWPSWLAPRAARTTRRD